MLGFWKTAVPVRINVPPQIMKPATAAILGFIPGLGQLYNGQVLKAFNYGECAAFNFLLLYFIVFKDAIIVKFQHCAATHDMAPVLQYVQIKLQPEALPVVLLVLFAAVLQSVCDSFVTARKRALGMSSAKDGIQMRDVIGLSLIVHKFLFLSVIMLSLLFSPPKPAVHKLFFLVPSVPGQSQSSTETSTLLKTTGREALERD